MSYKVKIELDFDTYKPSVKDILEYINELGEDLGYVLINNKEVNNEMRARREMRSIARAQDEKSSLDPEIH